MLFTRDEISRFAQTYFCIILFVKKLWAFKEIFVIVKEKKLYRPQTQTRTRKKWQKNIQKKRGYT